MMMNTRPGHMILPLVFILASAWVVWRMPVYLVVAGVADKTLTQTSSPASLIDGVMMFLGCASLFLGIRARSETGATPTLLSLIDRISLFLGRVTMMLILILLVVMIYEVMMRYLFESPTLWANELSLWIAGIVFLASGLPVQQQGQHIRIDIIYQRLPARGRQLCDGLAVLAIFAFGFALLWGSSDELLRKITRWERFGTTFDPPIPATLMPLLILIVFLMGVQALVNLLRQDK